MAKLAEKARLYGEELRFAWRAPTTLGGSFRLMAMTAEFHARNGMKFRSDDDRRTRLSFDLSGYPLDLELRRNGSDLAVLYEVLAREAYFVPADTLPPERVRTIVDAGANIGLTALYFASRYPNARILAIEPNADNFELLKGNTAREPRIAAVEAGVTPLPRQKLFIGNTGPAWSYRSNSAGQGLEVRGASLSELMADHGFETIDLLKIDIEGAEREIFAKADFLDRTGTIVAELHGRYDIDAFNRHLARSGHVARLNPHARDPAVVLATPTVETSNSSDRL
ncbi:MAG: FkbM family methyltransferase [Hyphomicrobium sp.]|nr:FkbM family methyltransferase [Hyphomicrobium sp.]